ncbi:YceD family protein [Pseudofulvibacter geojedonensis]|uniref:YceD family protein n=1 Tax=Pseudofulvibacter geojedonensis TaxID=1123758 RepID=A0ABW3I0C1_9FLAO
MMKEFTIPFVGLKEGKHRFEFDIKQSFFENFDYHEFNSSDIKVSLLLNKTSTMMELNFEANGIINVNCDLTNEPFNQDISTSLHLIVKFGEEFNDENEEILILPHGEYEVKVQQYIYEMIVLAKPSKSIHPGVEDGTLDSEILSKLEEYSLKEKSEEEESEDIDPRWNKLKNLLTDK